MYTIGQVSSMLNIPISTLRYYDKEGLFPEMERTSGIRKFTDKELETLHVIECLKKSGMQIKDIKLFMQWCVEGPSSYPKRKALFEARKKVLLDEMKEIEKNLAMIEFKCWYYDEAIKDGNEDNIQAMMPDKLPDDIQNLYNMAHGITSNSDDNK